LAEAPREIDDDLPVDARVAGRRLRGVQLDDAPLDTRRRSFVLLVQRTGQDDVGVERRLRQEEVDDRVELQLVERFGGERSVGKRYGRVEADREQALDLAGMDRVHDLLRSETLPGNLVDVATPHRCDVRAMLGIRDVAVARQLFGLVALLAPALSVALT